MSFYVDGLITTIYKKDDFTNKETGEFTEGGHYVQVMVLETMADGSNKAELIDFKTSDPDLYTPLLNKKLLLAFDFSHWKMNNRSGLSYKMLDSANKAKFEKAKTPSQQAA